MRKTNWLIYTRGPVPLHRIAVVLKGIPELATQLGEVKFEKVLMATKDEKFIFCWDEQEIKTLFKRIIEKLGNKKQRDIHFKKIVASAQRALARAEKIRKADLKKCSPEELAELYDFLHQEAVIAHTLMSIDIDAMDICFEDFLKDTLRHEVKNNRSDIYKNVMEAEFLNLYNQLVTSVYTTFITQEEIALMEAALKNKSDASQIKEIYDHFWWVTLGWENMSPRGQNYYKTEFKKYSKDKNLKEKLEEIKKRLGKIKKQRADLIKKYHLSKEINYWLDIIDKYAYFHDLRKEMQVRTVYSFHLLMKEVARRYRLREEDLEWLWHDEIKDLLRTGDANIRMQANYTHEINDRRLSVYIETSRDKIFMLKGQEALEKIKGELEETRDDIKELKGLGVSGGYVKGRVKVCNGAQDALSKIEKGDILVCGMTLPDYVPAMKKASVIITNEGGITCHAAIISRELKIPCVVGTKIATEVLKDGDVVEVDARHGIIKKL